MEDSPSKYHKNYIISRHKIHEFLEEHPEERSASQALDRWYDLIRKTHFENPGDIRKVFPAADLVDHRIVFNVGGNRFRVIVEVFYDSSVILIRHVLTHGEYDEGKWKA